MRAIRTRAMLCDRTREWAAIAVDGELSEFEGALMRSHLDRCAECRGFAADVAEVATRLRSAPPETLSRPVTLPSRRRSALRYTQAAAAAAVLLAAAGLGGLYGSGRGERGQQPGFVQPSSLASISDDRLVRAVQLAHLKPTDAPSLGELKPALPISI